jgi:hypothetical protein
MIKKTILFIALVLSLPLLANSGVLSPEEIQLYYQQGYVIQRNAIDPVLLNELSTHYDYTLESVMDTLTEETYPISNDVQKIYIKGSQVVFKKCAPENISILRIVGCGSIKPEFYTFLTSDWMLQAFFNLLETDTIEQLICQMHPKTP